MKNIIIVLVFLVSIVIASTCDATIPLGDIHNILHGEQVGSDYYPSDDAALDQIYASIDSDVNDQSAIDADIVEGQQQ